MFVARLLLLVGVLGGLVVYALASTAGASQPHLHEGGTGALGVEGMTEKQLFSWETALLGRAHAAEHAALRREARLARRAGNEKGLSPSPATASPAAAAVDVAPEVGGRWNGRFDIPVMGINAAMLPTGKVMFYAYPNEPDSAPRRNEAWAAVWDPTLGTGSSSFTRVDPPIDPATGLSANIWCSGTSFLADGRLLVTGGNLSYFTSGQQFAGLNHVYTFNPWNQTWTRQPNMAHGRWYPSQMLMPDGRTVIMQGLDETTSGAKNPDVEIFAPSPDLNGVGTLTKLTTLPTPLIGDYYPHMFWMPSGRGLIAGPYTNDSWLLNNPGPSNSFSYTDITNLTRTRVWGNAVLVPGGTSVSTKVLEIGGSNTFPDYNNAPASNTTEVWNEANPSAGWQAQPSLNVARSHANTVILPDGSMVTVGGGVGSDSSRNRLWTANPEHMQVELWNPATGQWTLGPSQLENRAYHSTALLLPDGRVLSAGDDRNGGFDRDTAEIYEPAYLFKGARPTISSAPTEVSFNTTFDVDTPNTNVTKAVIIAPGAATHAVDMNQRYVPLAVAQRAGGVRLTAPADGNVAPPGYYMLFLVNSNGVPSVAKWVKVSGTTSARLEKAQGKPTTASSSESATYGPQYGNDGSLGTRWSSSFADNQWWQVDLGSARTVDTVEASFNQWAWPRTYTVSTSTDGTTWAVVANETLSTWGTRTSTFPVRSARYVRITGLTRGTAAGTSIEEAKVYGPATDTPPPPPSGPVEKAQGKPTTASSSESATYGPQYGNDGSLGTRWSSSFADNQWWQVDLGSARTVDTVEASFNQWAWPRTYTVSTSTDGTTWAVVANETLSTWGTRTSTFPVRSARYVRITGLTRGTAAGTSIEEAKVYGPATDTPPPPPSNQSPVAVASASPTSGAAPLSVNFSGVGSSDPDGTIASWTWDFDGDGQFDDSSVQNPSYQYTSTGTYVAKLRVTDNGGAQDDSDPVTITVTTGSGSVEKAQGKPTTASSSESATYGPQYGNDGDLNTRWSSSFADNQWWQVDLGSARTVDSVQATFNRWAWPRTYTVSTSTDGTTWAVVANETLSTWGTRTSTFPVRSARYVRITGLTRGTAAGTSIEEAKVYGPATDTPPPPPPSNQSPVAAASASPTSGTVPLTVAFSSAGSSDPDGTITGWAWDLDGDGQYDDSTAQNPSQQYTTAGTYVAKLRVTDNAGAQDDSDPVTITAASGSGSVEKALGRPATASSSESSKYAAQYANDGKPGTRWSSSFADNQWWQVDLGSQRKVDKVTVTFNKWAWPKTYTVSVSTDGTNWAVVANETLSTWGTRTSTFGLVTVRYVRITGLTRGTSAGTSIEEAAVYGPVD